MIARKVCDSGMECSIILGEGWGNFSPCLTPNSRDLKGRSDTLYTDIPSFYPAAIYNARYKT